MNKKRIEELKEVIVTVWKEQFGFTILKKDISDCYYCNEESAIFKIGKKTMAIDDDGQIKSIEKFVDILK